MDQKELIEKYLQKRLSKKETITFNELINSDTDFKEAVKFHTDLKKTVKKVDANNFRNLILDIEKTAKTKSIVPRRSFIKWVAAASIILLFGLTYFLNIDQKVSTNDLFASNFEPYRNVVHPITRSDSGNQDDKTLAFVAYEKGEYKSAVTLFAKLYKTTKESYYLFYQANALLKLDKANDAVPLLLTHLKTKDTLTEKTNWYLALAYLKINDEQKAKTILEKVITNKTYKVTEAQKLLKALN